MSKAMQERGRLEDHSITLQQAIVAENDATERKRLILELDAVTGQGVDLELTNAEEFRAYDRQTQ